MKRYFLWTLFVLSLFGSGEQNSLTVVFSGVALGDSIITGEQKAWQTVTISFTGPQASQSDTSPNPFLDYRLQVQFTGPSGQVYNVPGYFDGNGDGLGVGNVWRVKFTPDEAGSWSYNASFRQGWEVAIDISPTAGKASSYIDGSSGKFDVAVRNANADGFLSKGRLVYENDSYYLKTIGDGKYWIKGGTDSPENFLAYDGFVNTTGRDDKPEWFHDYDQHIADWNNGDPDWDGGKGKGIIGSLNYLSSKHVNSIYILLMNIGGDGQDVWPWSGPIIRTGGDGVNENKWFDISKLRQWEIVFDHAQKKGINLNFVLNEGEKNNKRELDNALLGTERKLYYREMIARFGHHNALQWMLCEEYDHPDGGGGGVAPDIIKSWAQYIKDVDAYRHPVSVHNCREEAWDPFFGDSRFDLTSFQIHSGGMNGADYSSKVELLRNQAFSAGRKIAICLDETVTTSTEDNEEHIIIDHGNWKQHVFGQSYIRKNVIYPIYFSGGSVELILHSVLATDNFHQYNNVWDYMYYARKFMEENIPFHQMQPHDELLTGEDGHGDVLAGIGTKYAIYLPEAQNTGSLDLTGCFHTFTRRWYNPRTGDFEGTATVINGGDIVSLGTPPGEPTEDWVVLLEANTVARVTAGRVVAYDFTEGSGDQVTDCISPALNLTIRNMDKASWGTGLSDHKHRAWPGHAKRPRTF